MGCFCVECWGGGGWGGGDCVYAICEGEVEWRDCGFAAEMGDFSGCGVGACCWCEEGDFGVCGVLGVLPGWVCDLEKGVGGGGRAGGEVVDC